MSISGIGMIQGLDQASLQEMRDKMFARADKNGDGVIDESELQDALAKAEEQSGQTVDAAQLLADFDEDEDGVLNQDEMESAMDKVHADLGDPLEAMRMQMQMQQADLQSMLLQALGNEDEEEETAAAQLQQVLQYKVNAELSEVAAIADETV